VWWVFWALAGAALVHVAEEYLGGWVPSVQRYIPGVTWSQFVIVNAAFLILCVAGAVVGTTRLTLALSVASLVLVNAAIHVAASLALRQYSPGIISSVLLYLPFGLYAFYAAARSGEMSLGTGLRAALLGVLWMAVPLGFQAARLVFSRAGR
jgi:hypothetical protein